MNVEINIMTINGIIACCVFSRLNHSLQILKNFSLWNFQNNLIKYEQIITTLPKAKVLKPQADKIITLGKKKNLQNTKRLVSKLQDKTNANKVIKTLSKRYEKRSGGYTRIVKAGFRYGDNAPLAVIEFVDRDVEAKRKFKKKKSQDKPAKTEEKKSATA